MFVWHHQNGNLQSKVNAPTHAPSSNYITQITITRSMRKCLIPKSLALEIPVGFVISCLACSLRCKSRTGGKGGSIRLEA